MASETSISCANANQSGITSTAIANASKLGWCSRRNISSSLGRSRQLATHDAQIDQTIANTLVGPVSGVRLDEADPSRAGGSPATASGSPNLGCRHRTRHSMQFQECFFARRPPTLEPLDVFRHHHKSKKQHTPISGWRSAAAYRLTAPSHFFVPHRAVPAAQADSIQSWCIIWGSNGVGRDTNRRKVDVFCDTMNRC